MTPLLCEEVIQRIHKVLRKTFTKIKEKSADLVGFFCGESGIANQIAGFWLFFFFFFIFILEDH